MTVGPVAGRTELADWAPVVRRLVWSMGVRRDVDDAVQEGMVGVWRALQRFDGRGDLDAFAFRSARLRVMDWRRVQSGYRAGRDVNPTRAPVALPADWDVPVHEHGLDAVEWAGVFDELDWRRRMILSRWLTGWPVRDVALELGVSERRAFQLLSDALERLRSVVTERAA